MPSWNCCVMNCKNNTHGPLRFFSFPKDIERRQLWAESCGNANWYPTDLSRICEIHFDKSQFEQNQQDGIKLLKWSAIPRMYEEWNKDPSSPGDERYHRSYEYDVADTEELYPDYRQSGDDEMENILSLDSDFAEPEVEGMLESEWSNTERLKRKRTAPDDELESENCVAKRSRNNVYAFERTEELEDELSRIKADIKRLLDDTNTEKASDVFVRTDHRHFSPISAATRQRSKFKELKTSPGMTMSPISPPSRNKRYLQETNSTSLQLRQRSEYANQSNKTSGMKTSHNSGQLYKQHINESSSVPSVAKTSVARVRQHPNEQLQRTEGIKKTGSNIIPSSQHPTSVISEMEETTYKQSSNISSRREALLKEIMEDTKPSPKRNSSDKPWRAPEELIQFMKNAVVCFAPGEKGTLSQIIDPQRTVNARTNIIEALKGSPSKVGEIMQSRNLSKGTMKINDATLSKGKAETKSSLKSTTETKSTLPRIVRVQSLNLLKDEAQIKGMPSRNGESQSRNTLKNETSRIDMLCPTVKKVIVPRFIKVPVPNVGLMTSLPKSGVSQRLILPKGSKKSSETPLRIGEEERSNISIDTALENESPSRVVKQQKSSVTKETTAVKETPLRISKEQINSLTKDLVHVKNSSSETDKTQSRNLLKGTIETPLKTSNVKRKIAMEETSENQNSPKVPVTSNEDKSGSKTNGNIVVTPPETKSAQLKKLLASMISLEEDMFSEDSNLQAVEESNENTGKRKKSEVGSQTDDSESEQVNELKEEITELKQQLEEKSKTIQQLEQSLAAILPPGQVIMLQSGNDENYVIFNQQEAPS